jgi:hypothetical protein
MQKKSPDDDFDLGFRDGHDEIALRAMSYVRLCTEIEDAKPGTTKYMLLESEKRRRDSVQVSEPTKSEPHHAGEPAAKPSNHVPTPEPHWWKRPLGIVWLGIVGVAMGAVVIYLMKTHLGIS